MAVNTVFSNKNLGNVSTLDYLASLSKGVAHLLESSRIVAGKKQDDSDLQKGCNCLISLFDEIQTAILQLVTVRRAYRN